MGDLETFRIPPEVVSLVRQNRSFFKTIPIISTEKGNLLILTKDPETKTIKKKLPTGDIEVTFVYPLDNNNDPEDGRFYLKDAFVLDSSEKNLKSFHRKFSHNGEWDNPAWSEWRDRYVEAPQPSLSEAKQFASSIIPLIPRKILITDPKVKNAFTVEQRDFFLKALKQAREVTKNNRLGIRLDDPQSHYTYQVRENEIEVNFSFVVDNDHNPNNGRLILKDKFILDLNTRKLKDWQRRWKSGIETKGQLSSEVWERELDKVDRPTNLEGENFLNSVLPKILPQFVILNSRNEESRKDSFSIFFVSRAGYYLTTLGSSVGFDSNYTIFHGLGLSIGVGLIRHAFPFYLELSGHFTVATGFDRDNMRQVTPLTISPQIRFGHSYAHGIVSLGGLFNSSKSYCQKACFFPAIGIGLSLPPLGKASIGQNRFLTTTFFADFLIQGRGGEGSNSDSRDPQLALWIGLKFNIVRQSVKDNKTHELSQTKPKSRLKSLEDPVRVTLPIPQTVIPPAIIVGKKIEINQKIHFDFNSDKIREESFPILDAVAELLQKHPEILRVGIEGHTDDLGTEDYNEKLSEKRANAVRRYLEGKGIDLTRMSAIGYGKAVPLVSGTTEESRSINRRVEFMILDKM